MPRFDAPKRPPDSFGVEHYAGKVNYSSLLMMDKNKDFVIAEHAALLTASGFQFARYMQHTTPYQCEGQLRLRTAQAL